MELILRIILCAAGGAGCACAAEHWIRHLERQRNLPHTLSPKLTWLLILVLAVAGGVIGAVTAGWVFPLCALALLGVCTAVLIMDWCFRIIPNQTVLAVLVLKLLLLIPSLLHIPGCPRFSILQSLLGMVACFVVFSLPGVMGNSVGAGDIKLAAAMGFLLGIYYALLAVVIMGLLVLAYTALHRKVPLLSFLKSNIPMGPFLAVGMLAAFLGSAQMV